MGVSALVTGPQNWLHLKKNRANCFLVCWYKLRKTKSYFNNFWGDTAKNGRNLLGHGTLKSAISQECIDEMSWYWYKFMKAKSHCNNYWAGMLTNGQDLLDRGILKSGVSHKWFDESRRLIAWFLHTDSDWITFGLTANLFDIFDICWVSIVVGSRYSRMDQVQFVEDSL